MRRPVGDRDQDLRSAADMTARAADQTPDAGTDGRAPREPRRIEPKGLEILLALVLPVGIVAAIFLAPFVSDPTRMPVGGDTSSYIWRVNLVHDLGVGSLTDEATHTKALGERPGYPIVLSLLRSVTGLSSLGLAWLTPALFASALGLAAGSLATDGALERRGRSGAVAIAVGGSAFVAWTAVSYAANLALDVIVMAAAVMALQVGRGRRGVWGGAVLLAGAVLVHWLFAVVFILVLGITTIAQEVLRRTDADRSRLAGKRLVMMLVIGLSLGAGGLLLAPQLPGRVPVIEAGQSGPAGKVTDRLPALALPLTLPLALAGSALLAIDRRRDRRNAAVLLAVWSSVALVSLLAWFVLDLPLPPYRLAGFALAIPIAIVLGVFAAGDRFEWSGRGGGALIVVGVSLVATVGLAGAGASVWWAREAQLDAAELAQLGTLSSYLKPLPIDTQVVLVIDPRRRSLPVDRAWAGLPVRRLKHVVWVTAKAGPITAERRLPPAARDRPGTAVVALHAYRKGSTIGRSLGPGVTLISGPVPRRIEAGVPPRAPAAIELVIMFAILLAILIITGGGWAALSDLPVLGIVSVAPAFGVAILSGAGLVASRLVGPLRGPAGAGLVGGIALAGWATAMFSRARRRPRGRHQDRGSRVIDGGGRRSLRDR